MIITESTGSSKSVSQGQEQEVSFDLFGGDHKHKSGIPCRWNFTLSAKMDQMFFELQFNMKTIDLERQRKVDCISSATIFASCD